MRYYYGTMSLWSRNRQFTALFFFFFALILVVAFGVYSALNKPASCTDGKRNQGELQTDCGGPCVGVCAVESTALIPLWSRILPVRAGVYDVAAYIENHNAKFGVSHLPYSVKVYDKDNILIQEIKGETYVNPAERFVIFQSGIDTGKRIPARAIVDVPIQPTWERQTENYLPAIFTVKNRVLDQSQNPRVTATVTNSSQIDVVDVEAVVIVYNADGTAIAGSETIIPGVFQKNSSRTVVFTWPEDLIATDPYIEIYVRANTVSQSR